MTAIITVPFEDIVVGARMRQLRESTVTELMESIRAVGLLHPVSVTREGRRFRLIAGAHRLEAVKRLKIYARIQAILVDTIKGADQVELAEIDENLIRAELSPAECAMHVARRKEIYERQHPETKQGATPGAGKGKGKKRLEESQNETFVKDTAAKTGKGRSTVARDATRGKKVKVLPDIVRTSLDKGEEIDALAKLPDDEQQTLAERAKAGEEVSAKETAEERAQLKAQRPNKAAAPRPFKASELPESTVAERVRFLVMDLRRLLSDRLPDIPPAEWPALVKELHAAIDIAVSAQRESTRH